MVDIPKKMEKTIEKYDNDLIKAHWMILIIIILLYVTGGMPFYNWFMEQMNVAEVSISEIPFSLYFHQILGIIFTIVIIYYFSLLLKDKDREVVAESLGTDVRSYGQSVKLMLSFSRRKEVGEGERYLRSQRVLFILFIYTIGLIIMSGFGLAIESIMAGELVEESFENIIFVTHILSMVMFLVLTLIFIGPIIRRFDKVALKSILVNGKVPLWYLKKYHKIWYSEITGKDDKPETE